MCRIWQSTQDAGGMGAVLGNKVPRTVTAGKMLVLDLLTVIVRLTPWAKEQERCT